MVTEVLFSTAMILLGFLAGRMWSKPDDSVAWVDGFAAGYLTAMDDEDDVKLHREGDRHDA